MKAGRPIDKQKLKDLYKEVPKTWTNAIDIRNKTKTYKHAATIDKKLDLLKTLGKIEKITVSSSEFRSNPNKQVTFWRKSQDKSKLKKEIAKEIYKIKVEDLIIKEGIIDKINKIIDK